MFISFKGYLTWPILALIMLGIVRPTSSIPYITLAVGVTCGVFGEAWGDAFKYANKSKELSLFGSLQLLVSFFVEYISAIIFGSFVFYYIFVGFIDLIERLF